MSKKVCKEKSTKKVENPKYECKKCGGVAKKEKKLCKAKKI